MKLALQPSLGTGEFKILWTSGEDMNRGMERDNMFTAFYVSCSELIARHRGSNLTCIPPWKVGYNLF